MSEKDISVSTPIGEISIKTAPSSDYPGIWVKVNNKELVLVEYDSSIGRHVIRVWDHKKDDDSDAEYSQIIHPTPTKAEVIATDVIHQLQELEGSNVTSAEYESIEGALNCLYEITPYLKPIEEGDDLD